MYVLLSIVIILLTLLYIFIPSSNQSHKPEVKETPITPPQEADTPIYTRNDYNSINNLVQVSRPRVDKTQLKGPQMGILGENTIHMRHLLQEYGDLQTYGLQ